MKRKGKGYVFISLFSIISLGLISQNQRLADSFETIYLSNSYDNTQRLHVLNELSVNHTDIDKKLAYSNYLIEEALLADSSSYVFNGYVQKGNAERLKSDLSNALESFIQAANIALQNELQADLGKVYIAIADVYSIMGNPKNAEEYYENAIEILRQVDDKKYLGIALSNAGDEYFNQGKLDEALSYFDESRSLFRDANHKIGEAYNLGNVGLVYAEQGRDELAESNIDEAIQYLEELEDYYPICVYLTYMSDIYLRKNDYTTAISHSRRSLSLAKRYGLKDQISDANLKLSEIYDDIGNHLKALEHYKEHIAYRDSVQNIQSVQEMADLRTDFEVSQKQVQIDLLEKENEIQQLRDKRQKNFIYASSIALVCILLLALGIYRRYIYIKRTNKIIQEEKERSDNLLLNILPEETATELKRYGKVEAKRFDSVTVLFADFESFTTFSESLKPETLVDSVDFYFSKFDEIIEKYGLEKIKTIGDAYMCAGGLPFISEGHALKMIQAAREMNDFVDQVKNNLRTDLAHFDIRIGINTGPVIAGVVGIKKFAYDIWGDTVNIAARMESSSEPGKINISENTFELVKDSIHCKYRGEVDVKNKGMMKMYFVNGRENPKN